MIDVKVTVLGQPELGRRLDLADRRIRTVLREELAEIGEEIVARARANAPKRTGIMASRIAWYLGREFQRGRGARRRMTVVDYDKDPRIFFTVRPRGRIAHLVERGVNATFQQFPGSRGGRMPVLERAYTRTLTIAPRPFFMPAVQAVTGGNVFPRLQARLDELARLS
jgi:hypothetical protein